MLGYMAARAEEFQVIKGMRPTSTEGDLVVNVIAARNIATTAFAHAFRARVNLCSPHSPILWVSLNASIVSMLRLDMTKPVLSVLSRLFFPTPLLSRIDPIKQPQDKIEQGQKNCSFQDQVACIPHHSSLLVPC